MRKPHILILLIAFTLSGCSHYYYVPNVQNVPLLKEKEEFHLSASLGGGEESVSTEIQAALALTDNIGIMANFMSVKGGNHSENDWGKGLYFEGALGYYKPFEQYGVFEVYGGVGGGSQHHEYYFASNSGNADLSILKFFVQPALGFTHNVFEIAFSTRLCYLSFYGIRNNISGSQAEYDKVSSFANKNYLFLEPAFTVRAGWKNLKLQGQIIIASYKLKKDFYDFEGFHMSFGLNYTFAKRYLKTVTADHRL